MPQPSSPSQSSPLSKALGQNESIQDTVEQSAAELVVINAVLKQELPPDVKSGDVAEALQKTDQLESRIQASAEDLAQVNQTLEQEIGERADLERELEATKAALAKATGQSSAS